MAAMLLAWRLGGLATGGPASPTGPGLLHPLFLYAGSANPGR